MKLTSLLIVLTAAGIVSASAADQANESQPAKTLKPLVVEKKTSKEKQAASAKKQTTVTGSYIKRDYRESGMITDVSSPLYIINASTIARTGAADVGQALIRTGFRR